jgi:ParB family chromosome partitioning protein
MRIRLAAIACDARAGCSIKQERREKMVQHELREIPLNQIKVKQNYRKTFKDETLKELAQSIKENGVIEPIIVRPNGSSDRFVIIAGERRFKAAEIAQLATIPAVVRDVADEDALRIQIIENVQRENVPFMEEAYGLQQLRDEHALDVAEICKLVGKSDAWVYQMLQLTRMNSEAQRLAANGFLQKPVAQLISRLKNDEDQFKAANDLARTRQGKLVDIRFARQYIDTKIEANGRPRRRRNAIQKQRGQDYCANWKKYLVNFSSVQFEYFKAIVRGRTDISTISEAVEQVMLETENPNGGGGGPRVYRTK